MVSALQLNVLDRFELRAASDPIAPIASKSQAMLAFLAVENERVSTRERIATLLETESYAEIKIHVDNRRWRGVPFYLRSGKRLASRRSLVAIRFRDPPHPLFCGTPCENMDPNWLMLAIQPEERIRFELLACEPGLAMVPRQLNIDTDYRADHEQRLDAYAAGSWGPTETGVFFEKPYQAWRNGL